MRSLFLTTYSSLAPPVALVGLSLAGCPTPAPMQGLPLSEPPVLHKGKLKEGRRELAWAEGPGGEGIQIGQAAKLNLGSVVWDCSVLGIQVPLQDHRGAFPPAAGNVLS